MPIFHGLESGRVRECWDRKAFLFGHQLQDHPALSMANLAEAIPALPRNQVFHSNGQLSNTDDFDNAHRLHKPRESLEQALHQLRTTNAYIMVRQPEAHPSFRSLHAELREEVAAAARMAGLPQAVHQARLYLFIASPGSVTPFHIDRVSTCLMQVRGHKEVVVYPPWDTRVVADEDAEHFFAYTGRRPVWRPDTEQLAARFSFSPGQTLHIPFAAGHHVRNGDDDVSISLSIIFNTDESLRLIRALRLNHAMRHWGARIGLTPGRVAPGARGIHAKSLGWRVISRLLHERRAAPTD